MAPDRPGWVIKDLSSILGLGQYPSRPLFTARQPGANGSDSDSIAQLVLPDLESYSNETRLKSHLQVRPVLFS